MAHAGYWASWADALHIIAGRLEVANTVANTVVDELNKGEDLEGCQQLQLGCTTKVSWCDSGGPTYRPSFSGAWRVATWLATPRVFCFRVPLAGDCDDCPVVCCRPGSFEVTLWTSQRRSVPRLSHPGGVPVAACTSPTAHHRSSVRVPRKARPSGTLCPIRSVEEQSNAHREDPGEGVSRSRFSCPSTRAHRLTSL